MSVGYRENVRNGTESSVLRRVVIKPSDTWVGKWVGGTLENIRKNSARNSPRARNSFFSQASQKHLIIQGVLGRKIIKILPQ